MLNDRTWFPEILFLRHSVSGLLPTNHVSPTDRNANVLFLTAAANSSLCELHMRRTWEIASISSRAGSQRRGKSFFSLNRCRMWTQVALPIVPDQRHCPLE